LYQGAHLDESELMQMDSKAKILGHPIHQMLIVFPLGLLAMGSIFDVIALVTGDGDWSSHSFMMIGAGILTGLIAAVFGLIDFLAIPSNTRARSIGLYHGVGNVVVIAMYIGSWLMRRDAPYAPEALALVLSFGASGLAVLTGWLGGELVDRLGVGVHPGAHLNAPNSLSGRPASDNA
jgi:uncharacterized membrane protein